MENTLKAISRLQAHLMAQHYQRAFEAKENSVPVVYVTAMFPVEIVKAFEPDLVTVYPENHAALLIARGQDHFVDKGEAIGLDRMGCAYELINSGYLTEGMGRLDAPPLADANGKSISKLVEPDVLLACDNQCRVICEWFKHLSERMGNKPYRMINVGDRHDGNLDKDRIAYVRSQIEDVIGLLEKVTGKTLDRDKLLETAEKSSKAVALWQEYLDLAVNVPSPITVFDGFYHMSIIVAERGKDQAIDYYNQLIAATREAGRQNSGNPEKHRLLWDNLATWYNFRELKKYLADRDIAVVGSTYLDVWRKKLDPSSYDALLDSMATNYALMYTNMTIPERIQLQKEMVNKYKADGILFHRNLSCHTFSLRVEQIARELEEHFGPDFKTVVFEGCQGIRSRFQQHAFEMGVNVHFCED